MMNWSKEESRWIREFTLEKAQLVAAGDLSQPT